MGNERWREKESHLKEAGIRFVVMVEVKGCATEELNGITDAECYCETYAQAQYLVMAMREMARFLSKGGVSVPLEPYIVAIYEEDHLLTDEPISGIDKNVTDALAAITAQSPIDAAAAPDDSLDEQYEPRDNGFKYGPVEVTRLPPDKVGKAICLPIEAAKEYLQIHVTKEGRVRVFAYNGEWVLRKDAA